MTTPDGPVPPGDLYETFGAFARANEAGFDFTVETVPLLTEAIGAADQHGPDEDGDILIVSDDFEHAWWVWPGRPVPGRVAVTHVLTAADTELEAGIAWFESWLRADTERGEDWASWSLTDADVHLETRDDQLILKLFWRAPRPSQVHQPAPHLPPDFGPLLDHLLTVERMDWSWRTDDLDELAFVLEMGEFAKDEREPFHLGATREGEALMARTNDKGTKVRMLGGLWQPRGDVETPDGELLSDLEQRARAFSSLTRTVVERVGTGYGTVRGDGWVRRRWVLDSGRFLEITDASASVSLALLQPKHADVAPVPPAELIAATLDLADEIVAASPVVHDTEQSVAAFAELTGTRPAWRPWRLAAAFERDPAPFEIKAMMRGRDAENRPAFVVVMVMLFGPDDVPGRSLDELYREVVAGASTRFGAPSHAEEGMTEWARGVWTIRVSHFMDEVTLRLLRTDLTEDELGAALVSQFIGEDIGPHWPYSFAFMLQGDAYPTIRAVERAVDAGFDGTLERLHDLIAQLDLVERPEQDGTTVVVTTSSGVWTFVGMDRCVIHALDPMMGEDAYPEFCDWLTRRWGEPVIEGDDGTAWRLRGQLDAALLRHEGQLLVVLQPV